MSKRQLWSEEEIQFLVDNYTKMPYSEIAKQLEKTVPAISCKAKRMKITVRESRRKNIKEKRFGRLVAIKRIGKNKRQASIWLCKCDCGNDILVDIDNLGRGVKSCGCWRVETTRKDLTGRRFGRLTAIKYSHTKGKHAFWDCVCNCGRNKTTKSAYLLSGDTKSCGNCRDYVNGVLVSSQQRAIAKMIDGVLNYKAGTRYIDIALPVQMMAIEYNGWYWHQGKEEQDRQRTQELISQGWHVFVIKSGELIPKHKTVIQCLKELEYTNYVELILDDWKD